MSISNLVSIHDIPVFLFLTVISLLGFHLIRRIIEIQSLPRGPWGLPIFGYLPFLKRHHYLQFCEIAEKYGGVFSLRLGKCNVVIINDWPSTKEAMSREELLARPDPPFFPGVIDEKSFAEMSGAPWRDQRRVALRILRDIGLGKTKMEEILSEEIEQFIGELDKHTGVPCDFQKILGPSVSNNIAILLYEQRFSYDDPVKKSVDHHMDICTKSFQVAGVNLFMPILSRILSKLGIINFDELYKSVLFLDRHDQQVITSHQSGENVSDTESYIDMYLKECEARRTRGLESDSFDEKTLRRNLFSFFSAGSETVNRTLLWMIIYLVKYPNYQEKIREEIASVIGSNRAPTNQDRPLMPFTMAFMYEVQRICSIAPLNLLRRAAKDVEIGIHWLPKDSFVLFNLYAVDHDHTLWREPEQFNPDRFLTDNDAKAVRPPYHVPFSGGKRNCPAESFAYLEMFLYLTSILQRYRIESTDNNDSRNIDLQANCGITRTPKTLPFFVFHKLDQLSSSG